jgi:hypothetical protein
MLRIILVALSPAVHPAFSYQVLYIRSFGFSNDPKRLVLPDRNVSAKQATLQKACRHKFTKSTERQDVAPPLRRLRSAEALRQMMIGS